MLICAPITQADVKEISESARDCSHADVVEAAQDLTSEHLHDQDIIDIIASTETAEHHFEVDPTSGSESPEPSKKRIAYQSDVWVCKNLLPPSDFSL